ncbi:UNVERIFIED_CONTAM: putative ribonuclease H protein [Sesamum radiatum]|uniref:Ribonuclease H protein n=1 Tax=Sesamum radiatum TaxID=300843 RepID=A0AAW2JX19_SESRA
MELGDIPLEFVDTLLYSFAGEVVHPLGRISLPPSLGTEITKRIRIVCFLVVDMPSVYNTILKQPALNTFQVVISTHHTKLKFHFGTKLGEVKDSYCGRHGDNIVWTGSSTGDFSTKSAWEAIRQASPRRQLLADIWHRSLRPTISVFLWRLFQDRIPVDARMRQKGFSFPSKCQCCEAEETVSYLFIESAAVQGVWQHFAAIFGLCLCDTRSLTHMVHFWRYSTPFHSDLHIRTLIPFLILWFTWTQRNAAKYRGVPFTTDGIILEVQRHLRTLYAARTLTSTQWKGDLHQAVIMGFIFCQKAPRAPSIVRWRAPSPSWFKLNTDGSSLGNPGLAGAVGIIRDSVGHVHLAYQFALGTGTSVLADLTAVWRGMELALTRGLAPLVVEVDATTVISILKSRTSGKCEVQHLIMRIVCLQQLLVADVQHIFREANGATDHLGKEAASLQLTRVLHHDDITGVLRGILCLDRQGVPHLHRG